MISYEESKVLLEQLRALIREIAAGDRTRVESLTDIGGQLFDSHFLDGYQYQIIYDLQQSPTDPAFIEKCLTHI